MKTYNALCNYVDFLSKTTDFLEGLIKYSDLPQYEGKGYSELRQMYQNDLFQLELRLIVVKHTHIFDDLVFNLLFEKV